MLRDGLRLAFDAIDDAFFDLANNARNNNEQNRYFEAMRELRLRRKSIEESVYSNISKRLNSRSGTQTAKATKVQAEMLSLVDKHTLEENLALETMCSKALANSQHIMLTLEPRLEKTFGFAPTLENNPLSPNTLADVISESCAPLDIQLAELLLLYKYIDKHIFAEIPNALGAVNDALRFQNVLPDLSDREARASKKPPSNHSTPKEDSQPSSGASIAKETHQTNRTQQQTAGVQKPWASKRELLSALDSISHQLTTLEAANQELPLSTANLLENVTAALATAGSKQVSEQDMDIINLVAMLFEFILDDQNLAPEMQALIGRLQIPVLKAVLQDPNFFNDHHHPARTFLDRLAKAAIGWTVCEDASQRHLYSELKRIVMELASSTVQNRELFQEADNALHLFCEREEKKRQLLEQRTKLTEEGRVKSRVARQFVESTLSELTKNQHLPASINELLFGPWYRVMFLAFLRDPEEHNWESAKRVAEELVWCAEHHYSDTDRQKWVSIVPKLLKQLTAGLEKISYDQSEASKLIEQVRKSLSTLFRESSLSNQAPKLPNFKKPMTKGTTSNLEQSSRQSPPSGPLNKDTELALLKLTPGAWIEFGSVREGKKRYKLVSHIAEADTYIFVDRLGLNPLEFSRDKLLDALTDKRITLLERGALVDRALSHVMANIKSH